MPGRGSWFVLGSVVTDARLEPAGSHVDDGCGSCSRCVDACPTGAIVAPGVIDSRRCLAWLVQAEGSLPEEYRVALGDRIYGCDDCQDVCPLNRVATRHIEAAEDRDDEAWVSLVELLRSSDAELLARHGRWYIPRRDPRYLRRNALVALGNVGDANNREVTHVLRDAVADADPMIREHARWAAARLGRADVLQPISN
jgi:epoxyqueuosine reductase